jgi:hypothetical protein
MGADLEIQKLIDIRNEILDGIISNLKSWDNEIESGIELIESNQISLSNLTDVNHKLFDLSEDGLYDEEYNSKLNLLMNELKKLTEGLKGKKKELIKAKEQLGKKDQVIQNYISLKRESVFIDKDVE